MFGVPSGGVGRPGPASCQKPGYYPIRRLTEVGSVGTIRKSFTATNKRQRSHSATAPASPSQRIKSKGNTEDWRRGRRWWWCIPLWLLRQHDSGNLCSQPKTNKNMVEHIRLVHLKSTRICPFSSRCCQNANVTGMRPDTRQRPLEPLKCHHCPDYHVHTAAQQRDVILHFRRAFF